MEQLFSVEYLIDLNGTKAAIRAGYSPKSARISASVNMRNPNIRELIRRELDARSQRTRIEADAVLRRFYELATVDVNEIVELRRVNCRYCWGEGFELQRTQAERDTEKEAHDQWTLMWQAAEAEAKLGSDTIDPDLQGEEWKGKKKKLKMRPPPPWSEKGGTGFDRWGDPNPACIECGGEGIAEVYLHDSRDLSPAARALYAGVDKGARGEVSAHMKDQDRNMENVAKHLGMFIKRHEDVSTLTREQRAAKVLELARTGARRKQAAEGGGRKA